MVEIILFDAPPEFTFVEAAEVMLPEEVRFLDEGEQALRVRLKPARHGRRAAARGTDNEQEPLDISDVRHAAALT
jgi:hypothetical protein